MTRKALDFDIVDHGIDHPDYFPGCGVAFTDFEHAVTGCGDNPREALDDVLDQIATLGDIDVDDLEARIIADHGGPYPDEPSIDADGTYYYLTIRYR